MFFEEILFISVGKYRIRQNICCAKLHIEYRPHKLIEGSVQRYKQWQRRGGKYTKTFIFCRFVVYLLGFNAFLRVLFLGYNLQFYGTYDDYKYCDPLVWAMYKLGIFNISSSYASSLFPLFGIYVDYYYYFRKFSFENAQNSDLDMVQIQTEFESQLCRNYSFNQKLELLSELFAGKECHFKFKQKLFKFTTLSHHNRAKFAVWN